MYRLREPLRAVRVSGDGIGEVAEIPAGARVSLIGPAKVPGLTEVEYGNDRFSLFHEDLLFRGERVLRADSSGPAERHASTP